MSRYAAILVSRQALGPCRSTPWVSAMLKAMDWLKEQGYGIVGTVGFPTWDLITVAAAEAGLPLKILLIDASRNRHPDLASLGAAYGLGAANTDIRWLDSGPQTESCDESIIADADLLVPISLRRGGTLERLVATAQKPIEHMFEVPYNTRAEAAAYRIAPELINPELTACASDYLFHWTRTTYHPWPDETVGEYCRAILHSARYPRTALATLRHILETGIIRASRHHMPLKTPCVSFSAAFPRDVAGLMRWRARYRQMSLEPYGIGIRTSVAAKFGIRPVEYVDSTAGPLSARHWYQQSTGTRGDWPPEQEHRLLGPLDLCLVSPKDLLAVCRFESERQQLPAAPIRVLPFMRDDTAT